MTVSTMREKTVAAAAPCIPIVGIICVPPMLTPKIKAAFPMAFTSTEIPVAAIGRFTCSVLLRACPNAIDIPKKK